jgi:hypothetical protein
MSETTTKKTKRKLIHWNIEVQQHLLKKYKISRPYFTMAMKGDRTSYLALEIKSEYERLTKELSKKLEEVK